MKYYESHYRKTLHVLTYSHCITLFISTYGLLKINWCNAVVNVPYPTFHKTTIKIKLILLCFLILSSESPKTYSSTYGTEEIISAKSYEIIIYLLNKLILKVTISIHGSSDSIMYVFFLCYFQLLSFMVSP